MIMTCNSQENVQITTVTERVKSSVDQALDISAQVMDEFKQFRLQEKKGEVEESVLQQSAFYQAYLKECSRLRG